MNKIKGWIVKYIKFCMKMMNKYNQYKTKILQDIILMINELDQIEVKDVFLLKRYKELLLMIIKKFHR